MYTNGNNKTPKELPGIHGHNRNGNTRHQTEDGTANSGNEVNGSYNYKKNRNVSGNNRNIITMNNQQIGAQYIHG